MLRMSEIIPKYFLKPVMVDAAGFLTMDRTLKAEVVVVVANYGQTDHVLS